VHELRECRAAKSSKRLQRPIVTLWYADLSVVVRASGSTEPVSRGKCRSLCRLGISRQRQSENFSANLAHSWATLSSPSRCCCGQRYICRLTRLPDVRATSRIPCIIRRPARTGDLVLIWHAKCLSPALRPSEPKRRMSATELVPKLGGLVGPPSIVAGCGPSRFFTPSFGVIFPVRA